MSMFGIVRENAMINEFENQRFGYVGESYEADIIAMESAKELYEIGAGLYIADVIVESAVVLENANGEVLLEGVVGDTLTKLKDMFKKLAAKIKEWFKKAKEALELIFISGEKFVKKYEKKIISVDASDYTYKGYNWDLSTLNTLLVAKDDVDSESNSIIDMAGKSSAKSSYASDLEANMKDKSASNGANKRFNEAASSDFLTKKKEEIIKKVAANYSLSGVDTTAELIKELREKLQGGDTDKDDIDNMSHASASEMIGFIKDKSKKISALDKMNKALDRKCTDAIKKLDELYKDSDRKGEVAPIANKFSQLMRFKITTLMSINTETIAVVKVMAKEYETALKGLIRHGGKTVKEGSYTTSSNSVLEAAMRFV